MVTLNQLYQKFDEFNASYFNSELIKPEILIKTRRSFLGLMSHKTVANKRVGYITISDAWDMADTDFWEVLLHEMIHLYIFQKGLKEPSKNRSHGVLFKKYAEEINKKGGWAIARLTKPSMFIERKKKRNSDVDDIYMCIYDATHAAEWKVRQRNYDAFIFRINKGSLNYFISKLKEWHDINFLKNAMIYKVKNRSNYNNYTECRTRARGRYIDLNKFNRLLNEHKGKDEVFSIIEKNDK